MILAAMIGYYLFAVGLLVLTGYVTGQQNVRLFKARADEMIAHLGDFHTPEQPDEPTGVIDHDKWLRAMTEDDVPPVGLLTASPDLLDKKVAAPHSSTFPPAEKVPALVLTFRVVPGASEDELASMTAHLLCRLSQREEELGGEGLQFDLNGSEFNSERAVLRLVPTRREGAAERVARLTGELNAEGRRVMDRAQQGDDTGIGAKIERNLKAPLPESALKQLEMAAVA